MKILRHKDSGFTLVEIMIVVALVAILAAIALPSYESAMEKGRRADGQGELLRLEGALERYLFTNNSYPATLSALPSESSNSVTSPEGFYVITYSLVGTDQWTLTATAQAPQDGDGNLTLNYLGVKTGNW